MASSVRHPTLRTSASDRRGTFRVRFVVGLVLAALVAAGVPPVEATSEPTCIWSPTEACVVAVPATGVSAGGLHTCVLLSSVHVDCYGYNSDGQTEDRLGGDAVAVAAGGLHTCVLLASGNVDCYGYNGQAEDYFGGDADAVSAGGYHTCVLLSNENVDCYGNNDYSQAEDYFGGDADAVSAGGHHTCVLLTNGNVDCYGGNWVGQSADYLGEDADAVSAGRYHTCVLLSNGNVDCYGYNSDGQAEDYLGGDAVAVAAGGHHTCVLLSNGNVDCYGRNQFGQAEDRVVGVAVAAGWEHTCVLLSSWIVDCYGNNDYGQAEDYVAPHVRLDGPYADVSADGPNCTGVDTLYVEKAGATLILGGWRAGTIWEGTCFDVILPYTITYPAGAHVGTDADGDGIPVDYTITQATLTVEKDGSITGPTTGPDGATIPGDPDDANPCNPRPQASYSGPAVTRDPTTGAVTVEADLTVCDADGTTTYTVHETTPGPFPQATHNVPTGNHRTEDADGDGVPTIHAEFATLTIHADGSAAFQQGTEHEEQLGGDPDDTDPTYPRPIINGPYADVTADAPDCTGPDTMYLQKVGATLTFQGTTHGTIIQDQCLDAKLLPLTITYPTGVRPGADADGDGVNATYTVTQATLTINEDGTTTGPAPGPDGDTIPGDPNDGDNSTPAPHIEGVWAEATPTYGGDTYAVQYKLGATVHHNGAEYGDVLEGTANPVHDLDGDLVPDEAEPTLCYAENVNFNSDGTCVGDDHSPPTVEGIIEDLDKILP